MTWLLLLLAPWILLAIALMPFWRWLLFELAPSLITVLLFLEGFERVQFLLEEVDDSDRIEEAEKRI
jgi:hypothetical protein